MTHYDFGNRFKRRQQVTSSKLNGRIHEQRVQGFLTVGDYIATKRPSKTYELGCFDKKVFFQNLRKQIPVKKRRGLEELYQSCH